jgi:uncharacterized protein YbjQ (UPF0145 family)
MGDEKNDLTRIEDLSEYLHPDDPEAEAVLKNASFSEENNQEDSSETFLDEDESDVLLEEELEEDDELSFTEAENEDVIDETPDLNSDELLEEEEELEDEPDFSLSQDNENEEFESEVIDLDEDIQFDQDETELSDLSADEEVTTFSEPEDTSDELNFDIPEGPNQEQIEQQNDDVSLEASETGELSFGGVEKESDPNDIIEPLNVTSPSMVESEAIKDDEPKESKQEIASPAPYQYKERENFQEIRNFGNNLSYGIISTQANPPFSILIENITSRRDGEYFISVLKEHGLVNDSNEQDFLTSLEYGRLLISQISEYSAIYLAHKFRAYPVSLKMGLADDIHSSINYDDEGQGKVSFQNINQNIYQEKNLEQGPESHIVLSTSLSLESYFVEEYLDILTVEKIISEDEFLNEQENIVQSEYYQPMMDRLKNKARNIGANGVVGIDFQHSYLENRASYKILCTGNAVFLKQKV